MDEKKLMPLMMVAMAAIFFFFIYPQLTGKNGAATIFTPPMNVGTLPTATDAGIFQPPEIRYMGSTAAGSKTNFRVAVSNVGAGIEEVVLTKYKATVGKDAPEKLLSAERGFRSFATTSININGNPYDMLVRGDNGRSVTWTIDGEHCDDHHVSMFVIFYDPTDPEKVPTKKREMLRVHKTFTIADDSYVMQVSHTFENKTAAPLNIILDQFGPMNVYNKPPDEFRTDSRTYQVGVFHRATGFVKGDEKVIHQQVFATPSANDQLIGVFNYNGTDDRAVWTAANKRFFTIIARPTVPAAQFATSTDHTGLTKPIPQSTFVASAIARPLYVAEKEHPEDSISGILLSGGVPFKGSLTKATAQVAVADTTGLAKGQLVTGNGIPGGCVISDLTPNTSITLSAAPTETAKDALLSAGTPFRILPNSTVELPIEVYMGPKELSTFEGDPAAPIGSFASIANSQDYVKLISFNQGGMCYWLTFSSIAMAILWALQGLHAVIPNYGVAIIILVIVIRLLLHPLTRNAQTSMAKMQRKMAKAQPELDRIKKKYPDDYQKRQTEQMRIFKEYEINPAGQIAGCAPMLLQTPIWIALYAGLAVDIHLRQSAFIPGWINDLANPDMVWGNFNAPLFHIPLLNLPIYGLNILPLLLGVVFFANMQIQMKNQPKPADDQQAAVQNMSKYMFFLFPLFLYNAPSGLNLYMFTSTLGGIFDTWIVRRHLRAQGLLRDQTEVPAK